MFWASAKKIPPEILFGCFGNPQKLTLPICKCANTYEKHLLNYKKYLYHNEFHNELKLIQKKSDIQGYYIYSPTKSFEYPKLLRDENEDD
jgi:hypothetical protein